MGYMERKYGSRYDKSMSVKDIAATVRKEIKAAVKAGVLPEGLSASVRCSGGNAIDVKLSFAGMFEVHTVKEWEAGNGPRYYHLAEGERVLERTELAETVTDWVEGLLHSFNHDGSDIQTDYFDVNFYTSVDLPRSGELPAGAVVGWSDAFTAVFNELSYGRYFEDALTMAELATSEPVAPSVEPVPVEPVAQAVTDVDAHEVCAEWPWSVVLEPRPRNGSVVAVCIGCDREWVYTCACSLVHDCVKAVAA